jgi:hypothetical protein
MFIFDGKSILNNKGLIISIIILCILLVLNYNRCFARSEGFNPPEATDGTKATGSGETVILTQITAPSGSEEDSAKSPPVPNPPPKNIRLSVTSTSCTINFNIDISEGMPKPLKFLVVLSQYNKDKKPLDSNTFYLSDEFAINNTQAANPGLNQNICTIANGLPVCQYTFNNLKARDVNGDSYLYRIGISAIYENSNSPFVSPSNLKNEYFILDTNINAQTQEYQEYLNFKKSSDSLATASNYKNTLATADGQYEQIKKQLGGYPDNLEISNETVRQNTLTDLIDRSMSLGKIVVDVKSDIISAN